MEKISLKRFRSITLINELISLLTVTEPGLGFRSHLSHPISISIPILPPALPPYPSGPLAKIPSPTGHVFCGEVIVPSLLNNAKQFYFMLILFVSSK